MSVINNVVSPVLEKYFVRREYTISEGEMSRHVKKHTSSESRESTWIDRPTGQTKPTCHPLTKGGLPWFDRISYLCACGFICNRKEYQQ
jgi:hypothetical protein